MKGGRYVYLYKDKKGSIQYVGYGKEAQRATSHQRKTHNESLETLIKTNKFILEIAGPFDNEITARSVETALISALNPGCNKKGEKKQWRFRPIGVSDKFADRPALEPLTKDDFLKNHAKVLFVRISSANFDDGRKGYDIASPPTKSEIVSRVEKYWQLNKFIPKWIENPSESPTLLVGVTGSPGSQFVIASMEINCKKWQEVEILKGGLVSVPLKNRNIIDTDEFAGRRIEESVGLRFGAFRSQFFNILNR